MHCTIDIRSTLAFRSCAYTSLSLHEPFYMSLNISLSNARTFTAPDCLAQHRVSIQEVDDEDGTPCSDLLRTPFLTCIRAAQCIGLPLAPGTHLLEPVSPHTREPQYAHVSTSIGESEGRMVRFYI